MSGPEKDFFSQIDKNIEPFISRLEEAIRKPSVSDPNDPHHDPGVKDMAKWLKEKLELLGVTTSSPGAIPSVVLGQLKGVQGSNKTVLLYSHYDVQPADEKGWEEHNGKGTKPFQPVRITGPEDRIVGRGSTDDKGPLTGWLNVIEAHNNLHLKPPVNVKFLFEGTEEVGSDDFDQWIVDEGKKPDGFFADVTCVCITDTYWYNYRNPSISHGVRGAAAFSATITGARDDLHSGIYGRMVREPMIDLVSLLGKLVDKRGVIQVPGVESSVPPLTPAERKKYETLGYTVDDLKKDTGVRVELSKDGTELIMGRCRYPSLSIHNITGGRVGTIIPRKVTANFSLRLVKPQDPNEIEKLVKEYLHKEFNDLKGDELPDYKLEVELKRGIKPYVYENPEKDWNYQAAFNATKTVYEKDPFYVLEGGSIPLVDSLQNNIPGRPSVVMISMGRSDDGAHSLSEKLNIYNYKNGTKVFGAYLYEIAKHPDVVGNGL